MVYKCKMCGANLNVFGEEICECECCGTKQVFTANSGGDIEKLLKRAFMCLEEGNFSKAEEYCDKVLDIDLENTTAFLGKLMCDYSARKETDLANCKEIFWNNVNYLRIKESSDEELKQRVGGYLKVVFDRQNERIMELRRSIENFKI